MNKGGCFLVVFLSTIVGCGPKISTAHITVKVAGDDGQPVPEARVVVMAFDAQRKGKSNKEGEFPAILRSVTGQLDLLVEKDGFYPIRWHSYFFTGRTNDQWQPWNPTIVLQLHEIGKPVPMVVKQVAAEMPILGEPIGYDLLKSDWVKPYGDGDSADFIFEAKRWSHGPDDVNGWLRLTTSHPGDGLLPVRLFWRNDYGLRLAASAPPDGYKPKWLWEVGEGETPPGDGWQRETNMDQDANYYLRVRTHLGTNDEPEGGMYGKIYRGISLGLWNYRTNVTVNFEYYLNPDGTRNTEFDTRSNLCANPGTGGGKP